MSNISQLYLFVYFILYVTDFTRVLSAVRNIYKWGIFSVVFTLLYCKDTDVPVTSLPDRKVSDKSETNAWRCYQAAQGTGLLVR